jgi:hypothetical protein
MNRILHSIAAAALAMAVLAFPALAQSTYPTAATGVRVAGTVPLQCNGSGAACAPVTASNPVPVTMAGGASSSQIQGNIASAATDSGNPVKVGGIVVSSSAPPALTTGQRGDMGITATGALIVAAADYAGTAGSDARTALYGFTRGSGAMNGSPNPVAMGGFVFNGTTWDRQKKPNTIARLLAAAASTNSTSVKGSAGDLFRIEGYNAKASPVYLKLYNKATAPTCGTDTPVMTRYVPASSYFTIDFSDPLYFATGIGYCLTGAAADADTTALVASDVLALNVIYQ